VDLVKLQGRQLKSGWEKEKRGLWVGCSIPIFKLLFPNVF